MERVLLYKPETLGPLYTCQTGLVRHEVCIVCFVMSCFNLCKAIMHGEIGLQMSVMYGIPNIL